jgi:hypothetical protein
MNLFLLALTALSSLSTSSVYALDVPFVLRGSANNGLESTCQDGRAAGQRSVNKLWKQSGSDCSNAFGLQKNVNRMKTRNYPDTGNWKTKSYNQCARDGADAAVKAIEKKCLNDDSSQCTDLGETAAEIIVYNNVCPGQYAAKHTNYKQTCRKVAYGVCQGAIPTKIAQQCSTRDAAKWKSTSQLSKLMDMCKGQVNNMTPSSEEEEDELEFVMN